MIETKLIEKRPSAISSLSLLLLEQNTVNMSAAPGNINIMTHSSSDAQEFTLEIPVWVQGKRKWVTGITKKTTFDDLIYALCAQADLLKSSDITNSSSNATAGYAIAECIQSGPPPVASSTSNEADVEVSLITQRVIKGRTKVIKAHKAWQFDQLPLTILHLISIDAPTSASRFRSRIFRRFLSSKSSLAALTSSASDSSTLSKSGGSLDEPNHQQLLQHFQANSTILERQKRLLDYLEEKIHHEEHLAHSTVVNVNDVSRLFSTPFDQPDQLVFATQLCNSILSMQERVDEKTANLNHVEQAISHELNQALHQPYDILPRLHTLAINEPDHSPTDLIALKNSIYRSRELSRIQAKEMHDLDLSLREAELSLGSKYDELKYLEYESAAASSNSKTVSSTPTPTFHMIQQPPIVTDDQSTPYDTLEYPFSSLKEIDEDSGINSLTSEDSHHHHHHQKPSSQLETLV